MARLELQGPAELGGSGIGRGNQDSLTWYAGLGGLTTRNFGVPLFELGDKLSGELNCQMFFKGRNTCHSCPVSCKQVFQHDDAAPYRRLDPVCGGAEYETVGAFGPACEVTDNLAVPLRHSFPALNRGYFVPPVVSAGRGADCRGFAAAVNGGAIPLPVAGIL